MKTWGGDHHSDTKTLAKSAFLAFFISLIVLIGIGWHQDWLAHPTQLKNAEENQFIEAEMVQMPQEAHLFEEKKKSAPVPAKPEVVLSKKAGQGQTAKDSASQLEEENQTQSAPPPVAASHGPIAVYAPPPVIPSYLQNQDLKTYVVIDFYVNSKGEANPRLVGSSGNEELDAIALAAVKKWQFRPAEKDNQAIDSKVRLRIVFEVK